jgi:hypothetical protein
MSSSFFCRSDSTSFLHSESNFRLPCNSSCAYSRHTQQVGRTITYSIWMHVESVATKKPCSRTVRVSQVSDSELAEFLVHHLYNITLQDTWYPNIWAVQLTYMGSKVLCKGGPQQVYICCFFVSYNGPINTLLEEEQQFAHQYVDIFVVLSCMQS